MKGKFQNGLDAAMSKAGIGTTDLAKLIDQSKQNVDRWRKGERRLVPEMAAKIAPHLSVSANVLLLLADVPIVDVGEQSPIGSALRQARRQRSVTIKQLAEAVDVPVEDLVAWEANDGPLSLDTLQHISSFLRVDLAALQRGEVVASDDEPLGEAVFVSDEQPRYYGPRDVEKLGVVAAGEDADFQFNGKVADYVARPKGLVGRATVFSLEVISDSMYPAYRKHDVVFCDRTEPQVGDDIIIETFPEEGATAGKAYIKRLKRRTKTALIVEQFNPPEELQFDPYSVKHLWRVVPNRELHGF